MPNLYVALLHYPVINKAGERIASAVTNLDLHDISRAAKTYGVKQFYVVTPLTDQLDLVKRIASHWLEGAGAAYNPNRRDSMSLIRAVDSFDTAVESIAALEGQIPKTIVTSAKENRRCIGFESVRELLKNQAPYMLVFGTAWGLAEDILMSADYVLEPIEGNTGYNHLSVRSAAAVILDRLVGKKE
jgi:hypothetical protein